MEVRVEVYPVAEGLVGKAYSRSVPEPAQ